MEQRREDASTDASNVEPPNARGGTLRRMKAYLAQRNEKAA
jgi:hypothetical protein